MSVRTTVKAIQDIMRQDAGVDDDAQRISQLCWMFFLKIMCDPDLELELLDPDHKSPIPDPLRSNNWAADPEGMTGDALLDFLNNKLFPELKNITPSGPQAHRQRVVRDVFEDAYNYMKSGQLVGKVLKSISLILLTTWRMSPGQDSLRELLQALLDGSAIFPRKEAAHQIPHSVAAGQLLPWAGDDYQANGELATSPGVQTADAPTPE